MIGVPGFVQDGTGLHWDCPGCVADADLDPTEVSLPLLPIKDARVLWVMLCVSSLR